MKNKRIIFIIAAVVLLIGILGAFYLRKPASSPKSEESVMVVSDQSFFSDFEVDGDAVKIRCRITLCNTGEEDQTVKLYASFPEDVENGLLTEERLCAYDLTGEVSEFTIGADAIQDFEVVFVGEFGGTNQKHDRLLPEITIVPVPD